jgi:hypothetical protein
LTPGAVRAGPVAEQVPAWPADADLRDAAGGTHEFLNWLSTRGRWLQDRIRSRAYQVKNKPTSQRRPTRPTAAYAAGGHANAQVKPGTSARTLPQALDGRQDRRSRPGPAEQ